MAVPRVSPRSPGLHRWNLVGGSRQEVYRGGGSASKKGKGACCSTWHILFLIALIVQLTILGLRYEKRVTGENPEVEKEGGEAATDGILARTERQIMQSIPEKPVKTASDAIKNVFRMVGSFFTSSTVGSELEAEVVGEGEEAGSQSGIQPSSSTCRLQLIGGRPPDNYGAWILCGDRLEEGGVVYSFGIGGDVSFDNALVEKGLTVHAFDPTITTEKVKGNFKVHDKDEIPEQFKFQQLGLAATDGVITFFQSKNPKIQSKTAVALDDLKVNYKDGGFQAAVLRFRTFMCMHEHKWVDVLKMDVEGVEMDICLSDDFRNRPIPADQILIEFHERMMKDGAVKKAECIKVLKQQGFHIVHTSRNKQEIAFARMGPRPKIMNPDQL